LHLYFQNYIIIIIEDIEKIQNGEDPNSVLIYTTRLKDFEMRLKKQYKKYLDFDEMR
jgi:hypothetical protein